MLSPSLPPNPGLLWGWGKFPIWGSSQGQITSGWGQARVVAERGAGGSSGMCWGHLWDVLGAWAHGGCSARVAVFGHCGVCQGLVVLALPWWCWHCPGWAQGAVTLFMSL